MGWSRFLTALLPPPRAVYSHDAARQRITLTVHTQPGAATSQISGLHGDALKIRVAAPAVDNQANAALLAFLAKPFSVRARRHGDPSRQQGTAQSD